MPNKNYDNIVKSYKASQSSPISRYKNLSRIVDDEGHTYIESYEQIRIPESTNDNYHIVESGEENRLDLISHRYYGTPLLYWVIAEANEISDMFDIPVGRILRIPAKDTLYGYRGLLT